MVVECSICFSRVAKVALSSMGIVASKDESSSKSAVAHLGTTHKLGQRNKTSSIKIVLILLQLDCSLEILRDSF